ncbi:MAG: RodZ domain-containing protein [Anaerolineales bacterium]
MIENKLSIGQILKQSREEQKLSLDEISVLTRVRVKYLTAIEADNFDVLPSSVQQKGFVRAYARALALDPSPLIAQLRLAEVGEISGEPKPPQDESITPPAPKDAQPLGEIGTILKTQRERLGFALSNVENQIFIPERYLTAIEKGSLEELPSTVQGRGMVKNYAQFLGLDPEPLLLNYAEVLQTRLSKVRKHQPDTRSSFSLRVWLRRFIASPTILWVGAVLLIVSVSIWSSVLIFGNQGAASESTATIPGVADILLPSLTHTPTPEQPLSTSGEIEVEVALTPEPADPEVEEGEPTSTPQLTGNEKVQIQLILIQRSWVRVTVDNILAFEGRLLPGSVKLFGGELSIEILTGNAGGVKVIYNQRDLGVMGLFGEVINRVYTAEGIVTPTPLVSFTPTPTETPAVTSTPTQTTTPVP